MLCEEIKINIDDFEKFAMSIGKSCRYNHTDTNLDPTLDPKHHLTTEMISEYWNLLAPVWASAESSDGYRNKMSAILQRVQHFRQDEKWLSLGCGPALYETWLGMKLGVNIRATDIAPDMIKVATRISSGYLIDEVKFSQMSMESIYFSKASFDRVLTVDALHWAISWRKAVAEISRVIKNQGDLYLICYTRPSDCFSSKILGSLTQEELSDELEKSDFELLLNQVLSIFEEVPQIFIHARKRA